MKKLIRGAGGLLALVAVLLAVLTFRAGELDSLQPAPGPRPSLDVDVDDVARRLSGALRFRTVSREREPDGEQGGSAIAGEDELPGDGGDAGFELDGVGRAEDRNSGDADEPGDAGSDGPAAGADPFEGLHRFLESSYPELHGRLERRIVGDRSLLYRWEGADPELAPVLLAAHLDVVPVEPGTVADWTRPPFGGEIRDGSVWGRGAVDDKAAVIGILEAVEALVGDGFVPERTVLLAFGHDEEVGGRAGARRIARLLEQRGVELDLVLDEGGLVAVDQLEGIDVPVGLVGIAEKGFLSLELSSRGEGGHSSMPPRPTVVGRIAGAVAALQDHPMPARVDAPLTTMFRYLAPEMDFRRRLFLANLWLFEPLLVRQFAGAPATDALIRTTTAPTVIDGGVKDNVLPNRARAVVNFRILPGDTVARIREHVERTVADPAVTIGVLGEPSEPSVVSPTSSRAFRTLARTIRGVFPGSVVAPYVVVGATDARHYARLTDRIYRFLPVQGGQDTLGRIHGTDERLPVEAIDELVRFYWSFLRQAAGE